MEHMAKKLINTASGAKRVAKESPEPGSRGLGKPMGKKLIVAEKPSVANDIARALGGFTRHGDYYESDDYVLSSAIGHLVQIAAPEQWQCSRRAYPSVPAWCRIAIPWSVVRWTDRRVGH